MSELDVQIEVLRLDVSNVAGAENRIGPIAARAAALFAARLGEEWPVQPDPRAKAGPVNLNGMQNEEAAQAIADGWIRELALKLLI